MATSAAGTSDSRGSRARVGWPPYRGTWVASIWPTKPSTVTRGSLSVMEPSGERGDRRGGDCLVVRGVAEGGAQPLAVKHAGQPAPAVVPHPVEGQRRDREPARADLRGLRRLAGPAGGGEHGHLH